MIAIYLYPHPHPLSSLFLSHHIPPFPYFTPHPRLFTTHTTCLKPPVLNAAPNTNEAQATTIQQPEMKSARFQGRVRFMNAPARLATKPLRV